MGQLLRSKGKLEAAPQTGTWTDQSGAIAAADTSQQVCPPNPERSYFMFQNHSDTDMWLDFDTPAVKDQPSIYIAAGQTYTPSFVHTGAVHVICGTISKKFTCKEA